jgi:uncharacterized protein YjdB
MRSTFWLSHRPLAEPLSQVLIALLSLGGISSCSPTRKISAPTTLGAVGSRTAGDAGAARAVAPGTTTITATSDRTRGSSSLTVSVAPVASVSVSPSVADIAVGGSQQLAAIAEDAAGNALSGRSITWASNNPAAATVSSTGMVKAAGRGPVSITATCEGEHGSSAIIVTVTQVSSVSVSPALASLAVGGTQQLTVTARDAAGNALPGLAWAWATNNPAAATVSPSGLVTGTGRGPVNVTATCEGRYGVSAIVVNIVPVASVAVTPANAALAAGGTQQLSADPKDAGGNTLTGRTISWSSNNTMVAAVGASGLVKGVAAGIASVSATCEGKTGASAITVAAPAQGSGGLSNCPRFPADNVWNRDISALPVQANSAAWLSTVFTVAPVPTGQQIHVNLGAGNGHYLNRTGSAWQSMTFGNCSDAGTYSGLYPYSPGVSVLQGGDPDHHCLMVDSTQCLLYELYDASSSAPTACDGVRWDLNSDALIPWGCSSADEAGLPIATGLFTYHELFEVRNINHALRWQCYGADISSDTKSPLWPARHTSVNSGYTLKASSLIPFGARIRLRADFQPTGAAASDPGFLALTAAMKKYGAFLGDRGSSTAALSGAMDSRWGSWPDNFMNWSAQWIPYLEVVDESGLMVDPNSGQSR